MPGWLKSYCLVIISSHSIPLPGLIIAQAELLLRCFEYHSWRSDGLRWPFIRAPSLVSGAGLPDASQIFA